MMFQESNLDDAQLSDRARELVSAGKLPSGEPSGMWGGRGRNEPCCVCLKPVLGEEIAFDLLFRTAQTKLELHMHGRCRIAWEQARQTEE